MGPDYYGVLKSTRDAWAKKERGMLKEKMDRIVATVLVVIVGAAVFAWLLTMLYVVYHFIVKYW